MFYLIKHDVYCHIGLSSSLKVRTYLRMFINLLLKQPLGLSFYKGKNTSGKIQNLCELLYSFYYKNVF